jgi:hypothetical protein
MAAAPSEPLIGGKYLPHEGKKSLPHEEKKYGSINDVIPLTDVPMDPSLPDPMDPDKFKGTTTDRVFTILTRFPRISQRKEPILIFSRETDDGYMSTYLDMFPGYDLRWGSMKSVKKIMHGGGKDVDKHLLASDIKKSSLAAVIIFDLVVSTEKDVEMAKNIISEYLSEDGFCIVVVDSEKPISPSFKDRFTTDELATFSLPDDDWIQKMIPSEWSIFNVRFTKKVEEGAKIVSVSKVRTKAFADDDLLKGRHRIYSYDIAGPAGVGYKSRDKKKSGTPKSAVDTSTNIPFDSLTLEGAKALCNAYIDYNLSLDVLALLLERTITDKTVTGKDRSTTKSDKASKQEYEVRNAYERMMLTIANTKKQRLSRFLTDYLVVDGESSTSPLAIFCKELREKGIDVPVDKITSDVGKLVRSRDKAKETVSREIEASSLVESLPHCVLEEGTTDVVLSFGRLKFTMRERYKGLVGVPFSYSIDEEGVKNKTFMWPDLVRCILRYETMTVRGQHWGLPKTYFDYIQREFNVDLECFASPFNHVTERYLSLFGGVSTDFVRADGLDKSSASSDEDLFVFDPSLGEFFSSDIDRLTETGAITINPPFTEDIFERLREKLEEWIGEGSSGKITEKPTKPKKPKIAFLYIPDWDDTPLCMSLNKGKLNLSLITRIYLRKGEYMLQDHEKAMKGMFNSSVYVLSNVNIDKGKIEGLNKTLLEKP